MSIAALALVFLQAVAAANDPVKDIAASDPAVRLVAARALAETKPPEAEKLLLKALGDDDWEVAGVAASGLGALGAKKAFAPLVELALEGEVRSVRRAAAEALARIDAKEAYEKLAKSATKDAAVRACEALASVGPHLEGKVATKALDALLDGRDVAAKRAAAAALVACAGEERPTRLAKLIDDGDVAVRAFAVEAAGASGDLRTVELLAGQYAKAAQPVVVRRVHAALRALLVAHPDAADAVRAALAKAASGPARVHVARALGVLGAERDGARALPAAAALEPLQPFLAESSPELRAAAAGACAAIGTDEALAAVARLAANDVDARVRRVATGIVARARGAKDDPTRALLLERLAKDADARVRETAAAALGVRGKPDVVPVLAAALADPDWRVVTSAAVSLGMTQDEQGVAPLVALYQKGANDWRVRADAVAGLVRARVPAAVPPLIDALDDAEVLVARTAYEFLVEIAHQKLEQKPDAWTKWWAENQKHVVLSVPEDVLERRKSLGYGTGKARTSDELFKNTYVGVDVLVLQSRGDHIENVLDKLGIVHRRTSSGQVLTDGLHPQGVFVANCTGEITADEAARLSWFVRAGGALFGSCWALRETVQNLEPGLVRVLETRGEVLDDVPAYPCAAEPLALEGVFEPDCRPIYELEGAHLIDVLDPEEVEVLVDSPECAAKYGGGDLAASFRLGHGVVLDSANHFDLQGFASVSLRTDRERKAYAVDHLGLSLARLRELRDEKFWGKTSATGEKVQDLSVFRLVTNFVWIKLLAEQ